MKYDDRTYYFQRESKNIEAIDLMKIKVAFKKGKIYCSLQSIIDKSLMSKIYFYNGLLNRQLYLENSSSSSASFPENIFYTFKNNEISLKKTIEQIIYDFNTKGKIFVNENDQRFEDARFKKAMEFIKSLKFDKKILKERFYEDLAKVNNSIPKNKNPIFCELVKELQKIENGKFDIENHMISFEFLHKYMFE
ncbi:MAG TPA: hypothetical protein VIV55_02000 [Flavobacterium sp.]